MAALKHDMLLRVNDSRHLLVSLPCQAPCHRPVNTPSNSRSLVPTTETAVYEDLQI